MKVNENFNLFSKTWVINWREKH